METTENTESNHTNPKWVLLSERLPEFEKNIVIKDNVGIYRTGNVFKGEKSNVLWISGTILDKEFFVEPINFNHYNWLDENPRINTITAEEFFRNKLKELKPFTEVITLAGELISAETAMRWAYEYKKLTS